MVNFQIYKLKINSLIFFLKHIDTIGVFQNFDVRCLPLMGIEGQTDVLKYTFCIPFIVK
jgi:hypothetical protein